MILLTGGLSQESRQDEGKDGRAYNRGKCGGKQGRGTENYCVTIKCQGEKETSGMERSPELVHDTFGGFCIGTCFKKLCNYQCNGSDRFHGKYHRAGR